MAYSTFEIVKNMGIRQERLREWIDRGFIEPSVQKAQGRGTKSLFSEDDLYKIGLFKYLLNLSLSRERAAQVTKTLSDLDRYKINWDLGALVVPLREEGPRMPYLDGEMVFDSVISTPIGHEIKLSFTGFNDEIDSYIVVNFSKIKRKIDAAFSIK